MGSIVDCLDRNTKEVNAYLKVNNDEQLKTINTNKNDQTKPDIFKNGNGNINMNDDNCNGEEEEEEEKEEEKEEEEKEEEKEEEEKDNNDSNNEEEKENKVNNENLNKYKNDLIKIQLIQKAFRLYSKMHINPKSVIEKNNPKNIQKKASSKNNIIMKENKKSNNFYERSHTVICSLSSQIKNTLKKNVHKYDYSIINPKLHLNEHNEIKNDDEEIISVEQPFLPIQSKKSTRMANNIKALSKIITNNENHNTKKNVLKIQNQSQNYLRILSDFGEKKSQNNIDNIQRSHKFFLLANKEKKDKKIKKNQDNIRGNFILKNEKIIRYQGGFIKKTKKKNGFGIVTWSDNSTLHGTYTLSMLNGICRFYNNKYKSTFIGEYENNNPKGFGVYHIKNLSLQGYWECSNLNGIAIEVWNDGTYYQGEYENNKKNGIGLYRWPDGTIYQGDFNDGQMTGRGIIFYSDDSIFSGEMVNGYMNGYGMFTWGNGALYMGYYLQDIKHGFGIYIWETKTFLCYIGFWEMGKQHGIGAKINGNKIKYCLWNKGKITTTLKGLYEIDGYLTEIQKKYYHFFTYGYIAKLRANGFYNSYPSK